MASTKGRRPPLKWLVLAVIAVLSELALTGDAEAEVSGKVRHTSQPKTGCFRGAPLPGCKSFLIMEFGLLWQLDERPYNARSADNWYLVSEVGFMINTNPRDAWGGTVAHVFDDYGHRGGLCARYRRWLGQGTRPKCSIEPSVGLLFWGSRTYIDSECSALTQPDCWDASVPVIEAKYPSFMAGCALNYRDLISLKTRLEVIRLHSGPGYPKKTDVAAYGGVSMNSYLAPISFALFMALAAAAGSTI